MQQRFRSWVRRRLPPSRQILLDQGSIFIIPNRQGLGFCLVLGLMLVGAINYQASLAFAVVFLLAGLFLTSIFHTFRNLSGLRLSAQPGEPVFAGEEAQVTVIVSGGQRQHEALELGFAGAPRAWLDLLDQAQARVRLFVPAHRRGWLDPGRLTIETVYPFGICRAWSLPDLDLRCLVWPRPVPCDLDWLLAGRPDPRRAGMQRGGDDFYALREYARGDSMTQVSWKVLARGQGMFTKQFSSHHDDKLWLDWEMFEGLGTEERLGRLSWCLLQLEGTGVEYGLRLPGLEVAPAQGAAHYRRLMEHLALFGLPSEAGEQA